MESSGIMARISALARSRRLRPTLEHLSVLVVAHRQLYLHVFGGVQSVGIFEMSVSDGAGASQQGDHFLLGWDQVHSFPYCCAISGPNAGDECAARAAHARACHGMMVL